MQPLMGLIVKVLDQVTLKADLSIAQIGGEEKLPPSLLKSSLCKKGCLGPVHPAVHLNSPSHKMMFISSNHEFKYEHCSGNKI